jgi:predicted nuclease of predicted toxin-antitoxin system
MSIRLLVDMNLSPAWVEVFKRHGWQAIHWSQVGSPAAPDRIIMAWAQANGYVVFTHDLDFGTILAVTQAEAPSVIQVRTQDVFPEHLESVIVAALRQYEALLEAGALIVVDESTCRARVLPVKPHHRGT